MQTDVRGWGEFALRVLGTVAAAVLGAWGMVRRTINAMGKTIRKEFKDADRLLEIKIDAATNNCTRHDEDLNHLTAEHTVFKADLRGFDQTYGAIEKQLEQIEKKIDDHIAKRQEERIALEHRLTKLEGRLPRAQSQGDES